jgi:hypothetical protein
LQDATAQLVKMDCAQFLPPTAQRSAMQRNEAQCSATKRNAAQRSATKRNAAQQNHVLRSKGKRCRISFSAVFHINVIFPDLGLCRYFLAV